MTESTTSPKKLSPLARIISAVCGVLLIIVLFVPLWQIELAAPQYPEGLVLKMYPDAIAGDVDIINGLNHYIGMQTLHTENFIEFTILPYIIMFFAAFCFLVALLNRRKWLNALFIMFLLFGIIAMADFWRWEYQYGHNLDPNAAIQVPGQSYQPPLIGYKQLLNFGAYSIPDTGGILFILVGLLLMTIVLYPYFSKKYKAMKLKKSVAAVATILMFGLMSCNSGPQPIKIGTDACAFCKMTIADKNFGAEIITKKGKIYKFDDTHCLVAFRESGDINPDDIKETYLVNFAEPHNFIEASKGFYLKSEEIHSPMGGNIASFDDEAKMEEAAQKLKGEKVTWDQIIKEE